jgi:6-pyruvoyltetrahydropterin/6-carboxytetrahydropterin synthase
MICELSQTFYFEAAHTLDRQIDAAGSRRIHGHTYHAEITVRGEPEAQSGMVTDLGLMRQELDRVRDLLDHHFLDDVQGLGPATLENLCAFLIRQLQPSLPALHRVKVWRQASGDACSISLS